MRTLGTFLMLTAAAALILFPPCYHLTTRGGWRRSVMGWHLMSFMGVLGLVMCFAVSNVVFELPSWIRPLVWLLIGIVSWWRLILLFVVQHNEDRCPVCGRAGACGVDTQGRAYVHLRRPERAQA